MDFSFSFKKPPSGYFKQQQQANPFAKAEEQFNAIRGCGVNTYPKITCAKLCEGQDPASFEQAPYVHMLTLMGSLNDQGEPVSDDVWLFNPQSIGEEGHYSWVISHFMRIAKGSLPLEDVSDTLDAENGTATITFTLDNEPVEWTVAVEDGLVADEVITGLAAIAAERGDGARFAWADVDGQRLVVFLNEQDLNDLIETTGMEWAYIEFE
jgi:hypothetical protein